MELWVPITIAAAFLQNVRSALQKHLAGTGLSTGGATFVRFCYAAPLAAAYAWLLTRVLDAPLPPPNPRFVLFTLVGGTAQMLATGLLVHLFSLRNFAVGTTYSKTETVQTAIFGILILGETVSYTAAVAIAVSLAGVLAISVARTELTLANLLLGLASRAALIGMASGALFGISAVAYRAAALSLGGEGFLLQAAFTLAAVTLFQTLAMGLFLRFREPGQLTRVLGAWRVAAWVGVSGMLGSVCWFTAMTIQNAAYVRALGQVELVFTLLASWLVFHERSTRAELLGIGLIVAGILVLLLGR